MTYHWIITLQAPGGMVTGTFHGTVRPAPGATRGSMYRQIYAHAVTQMPCAAGSPNVLFFTLEPNDLAAS
jgi:hypothetical protein